MVYCGKPSKGCGQCRSRKIRCDQARPACSQCRRAKRECPGYRDQLSLMFRDESKSVIRKAEASSSNSSLSSSSSSAGQKRAARRAPRTASPEGHALSDVTFSVDPSWLDPSKAPQSGALVQKLCQLPLEVQPSPETSKQEAICYFLQSNALPGTYWMTDFVTTLLKQPSGKAIQRAMQASVVAVASAMFCRVKKVTSLQNVARKEYVSALKLLNIALTDVEEAKTNHALGAVVLLAVYEVVTSRSTQDIGQWTNHINGATALLDLRSPEQLKTEAGFRLFMHLRYQIIISCIQRATRVPESLLESSKYAMHLQPSEAHSNRLIIIVGRISNLRADIQARAFSNEQEIISIASSLEADLIAWLAALPPGFTYETLTKSPYDFRLEARCRDQALYDDQYHVYPNLWVCNTWNQYRCARIIVSEIILSHIRQISDPSSLRSLSDEFRQHCTTLQSTIQRLAVDICRSVPFHLGAHGKDASPHHPQPESYIGGLMLLWPLFLAGVVSNPKHRVRRWVVQCLRMIGHTMGLDQALAAVEIVGADPGILRIVTEEGDSTVTDESAASIASSLAHKKGPHPPVNPPYPPGESIPASVDANA